MHTTLVPCSPATLFISHLRGQHTCQAHLNAPELPPTYCLHHVYTTVEDSELICERDDLKIVLKPTIAWDHFLIFTQTHFPSLYPLLLQAAEIRPQPAQTIVIIYAKDRDHVVTQLRPRLRDLETGYTTCTGIPVHFQLLCNGHLINQ